MAGAFLRLLPRVGAGVSIVAAAIAALLLRVRHLAPNLLAGPHLQRLADAFPLPRFDREAPAGAGTPRSSLVVLYDDEPVRVLTHNHYSSHASSQHLAALASPGLVAGLAHPPHVALRWCGLTPLPGAAHC
jgi:hypothetical protein